MGLKEIPVALSMAGRDKGRLFAIIGRESENYVLIADGRLRKVQKPKKKKLRHVRVLGSIEIDGTGMTNRAVWAALSGYAAVSEGGCKLGEG